MEAQASAAAEPAARPPLGGLPEGAAANDPVASAGDASLPPPSGFREALNDLFEDARGAISERVKLVSLELRLATMTLMQVVVLAVIVAVLAVTAWLMIVGGVVAGFVSLGLHWGIALVLAIAINLGVAFALVKMMIKLVERVSLPKSLRRFNNRPEPG